MGRISSEILDKLYESAKLTAGYLLVFILFLLVTGWFWGILWSLFIGPVFLDKSPNLRIWIPTAIVPILAGFVLWRITKSASPGKTPAWVLWVILVCLLVMFIGFVFGTGYWIWTFVKA